MDDTTLVDLVAFFAKSIGLLVRRTPCRRLICRLGNRVAEHPFRRLHSTDQALRDRTIAPVMQSWSFGSGAGLRNCFWEENHSYVRSRSRSGQRSRGSASMLASRGDLPTNEIECCIARCVRPVVIANECIAKLSCRVITAKNFNYVRPRCCQLHDPILATLVSGLPVCALRRARSARRYGADILAEEPSDLHHQSTTLVLQPPFLAQCGAGRLFGRREWRRLKGQWTMLKRRQAKCD